MKESNAYGKGFMKGFSTLLYFSSRLQEHLEEAIQLEGSINIHYIDSLLVKSETKEQSQTDACLCYNTTLHKSMKLHKINCIIAELRQIFKIIVATENLKGFS